MSVLASSKIPQAANIKINFFLPGESHETKQWSTSELQRVVLLEQLDYYRTKKANLNYRREEVAWLYDYGPSSSAQMKDEINKQ